MSTHPFAGTTITRAPAGPVPTEKQVDYFRSLARKVHGENAAEYENAVHESGRWTKAEISAEIDRLRSAPAAATAAPEAPEGFHYLDGRIYKVQVAVHGSGQKYAALVAS